MPNGTQLNIYLEGKVIVKRYLLDSSPGRKGYHMM